MAVRNPDIIAALPLYSTQLAKTGRITRRPVHQFQVRTRPWMIQPFMIAPVLAGETMKNLLLQARVVSDPVQNSLIGWWSEYYFFYVKLTDLTIKDQMIEILMDPEAEATALLSAAALPTYNFNGGINYTQHCLDVIVDHYFRDEGDAPAAIEGLPVASAKSGSGVTAWFDSLKNDGDMPDGGLVTDGSDTISDLERKQQIFEQLRQAGMTGMTWEDYLTTFGVRKKDAERVGVPELIRYIREWTYPANTIDPSNGTPRSALSWSIRERGDKDRFFKEPGFVVGVYVARPKVYFGAQTGSAAHALQSAFSWLPATMQEEASASLVKFGEGSGPFPALTDDGGYWADLRDLFLYGDQFVNFAMTATDDNSVALPTPSGNKRYPVLTDMQSLFVDNGVAGTKQYVRQDGVATLTILGRQKDMT